MTLLSHKQIAYRLESLELALTRVDQVWSQGSPEWNGFLDLWQRSLLELRTLYKQIPEQDNRRVGISATLNLSKDYLLSSAEGTPDLLRYYKEFEHLVWKPVQHYGHERDLALFRYFLKNLLTLWYFKIWVITLEDQTPPQDSGLCLDPTRDKDAPLAVAQLHWLLDQSFFSNFEFEEQLSVLREKSLGASVDENRERVQNEWQRIKSALYRSMASDFERLLPRLAALVPNVSLATETDIDMLQFKLQLERYGYPSFSEQPLPNFEASLRDRVCVHFHGISEDSLAKVEALHELGAVSFITLEQSWHEDKFLDGRKRVWVKEAIVRGPKHYHRVKFDQPVDVHYGFDCYADMPSPGSVWHQRLTEVKDLGLRVLTRPEIHVPRTIWVCPPQENHLDEFQLKLRRQYPQMPVILCEVGDEYMDQLCLHLWEQGFNQMVIKPNQSDWGLGVRMGSIGDQAYLQRFKTMAALLLGSGQSFVVQERIEPPYLTINGAECDWNLRVFVTRNEHAMPVVSGMTVRYAPKGGPVNLSLTARTLAVEELKPLLGFGDAEFDSMLKDIHATAQAISMDLECAIQAVTPGHTAGALDWNGFDIIVRRENGRLVPYVIEINGSNSGAMWNIGAHVGDIAVATRDYARQMIRRAQHYRCNVNLNINESAQWQPYNSDQAQKYYDRLLQRYPQELIALEEVYILALQLKEYQRAEALARALIQVEPFNPLYWSDFGVALHRQSKLAALEAFQQAVHLNSTNTLFRVNLALAYQYANDWEQAEALLVSIGPEDSEYRRAVSVRAQNFEWQKRYSEQEKVLRDGLEAQPYSLFLRQALLRALVHQKRYDEALALTEKYLEQNTSDVVYRIHHLALCRRAGFSDPAVPKTLFDGVSDAMGLCENLAFACFEVHDYDYAQMLFELMLEVNPDDPQLLYNLGLLKSR